MLLPNSGLGKFPGEQTHLKRQKYALFTRHCPLDIELDGLRFGARIGDGHEQNVNTPSRRSAARDSPNDQQRLFAGRDRLGQRRVRRLVRKVLLASEKTQERPALQRDVIADRTAQHRVAGLKGVERGPQCHRSFDLNCHLSAYVGEGSQMLRKYDADHGSVCTSTDSTAGKSRTIGFQLSPASAEA
jgi:hypothetical protein